MGGASTKIGVVPKAKPRNKQEEMPVTPFFDIRLFD